MVGVDNRHLTRRADSPSELGYDLGSLIKGCLKLTGILARCTLDPATCLCRIGKVADKGECVRLEIVGHINELLHELCVVQWDLKVRNHHRCMHALSIHIQPEGCKSDMGTELVGPIRRSYGKGCMLRPHLDKYHPKGEGYRPSHRCGSVLAMEGGWPNIPVCLCPCHGLQMNPEEAEFYDRWIDKEIK